MKLGEAAKKVEGQYRSCPQRRQDSLNTDQRISRPTMSLSGSTVIRCRTERRWKPSLDGNSALMLVCSTRHVAGTSVGQQEPP